MSLRRSSLIKIIALECLTLLYVTDYTYLFHGISGKILTAVAVVGLIGGVVFAFLFESAAAYRARWYIPVFFILLVMALVRWQTQLLQLLCLVYLFRSADEKLVRKALKVDFAVKLLFFLAAFVGSLMGVVHNRVLKGDVLCYGFSHINRLGGFLFVMAIQAFLSWRRRWLSLAVAGVVLCAELVLKCRTGVLLCAALIPMELAAVLMEKKKTDQRICKYYLSLLVGLAIFAVAISFVLLIFYNPKIGFLEWLDHLLNHRLELNHRAFLRCPITLFGVDMEIVGSAQIVGGKSYFHIDNLFVYILYTWGILGAGALLFAYGKMLRRIYSDRNVVLMPVFVLFVLFGYMEHQMLDAALHIPLMYFGVLCLRKSEYRTESPQLAGVKVAFDPIENKENQYIAIMQSCLRQLDMEVVPLKQAFARDCKYVILNWHENSPYPKGSYKNAIMYVKRVSRLLLLHLWGKKIVFVFHNRQSHEQRKISRFMQKNLMFIADCIQIHSRPSTQYLSDSEKSRAFYIPLPNYIGVYPENSGEKKPLAPEGASPVFLFVGAVKPYKNIELILDAAQALQDTGAHFVIAGKPSSEDYRRSIEERSQLLKNVTSLLSFVPDSELPELLAQCDAVVLPYDRASSLNSGTVFLAFSWGKTVIAPRIATLEDIDDPSVYVGYDYTSYDAHRQTLIRILAETVDVFAEDPAYLQRMGQRAYAYARQHNDRSVITEKYREMFAFINQG